MEFGFSKEHALLKQMYREFAENEVKPLAAEVDEMERFPVETVEKMVKAGFMGIPFPKKYGGEGGDNLGYAMAVEELSRVLRDGDSLFIKGSRGMKMENLLESWKALLI